MYPSPLCVAQPNRHHGKKQSRQQQVSKGVFSNNVGKFTEKSKITLRSAAGVSKLCLGWEVVYPPEKGIGVRVIN
jgi:hypothetical protein